MFKKELSAGVVHKVPADLRKALTAQPKARAAWEDITPLARNEWICWVESVKKAETRSQHVRRVPEELIGGKRRPCCWTGLSGRAAHLAFTSCSVLKRSAALTRWLARPSGKWSSALLCNATRLTLT